MAPRRATLERSTGETSVSLSIDLDGRPQDLTYYQPGRNVKLTVEFVF